MLASAVRQAPTLMVLDNLHGQVSPAVRQLLEAWADRHPDSLLLATAWSGAAFGQLHSHLQPGQLQVLSMSDIGLVLHQSDAAVLLEHFITISRKGEQLPALPAQQLQALADEAAVALRFSSEPAYTPQVLCVSGRTLGLMADRPSALLQLRTALHKAQEVAELAKAEQLDADDHVFSQLRACYSQLSEACQQTFVGLEIAHQLEVHHLIHSIQPWDSVQQLALWLSCHQLEPCSSADIVGQVSNAAV